MKKVSPLLLYIWVYITYEKWFYFLHFLTLRPWKWKWPLFGLYSISRPRCEKMQKIRQLFIYNWGILHIKVALFNWFGLVFTLKLTSRPQGTVKASELCEGCVTLFFSKISKTTWSRASAQICSFSNTKYPLSIKQKVEISSCKWQQMTVKVSK